jgi:hypothetical protein
MANPQNLKPPWVPGQSGNPAGHSEDRRLATALFDMIDRNPDMAGELIEVAFTRALAGSFPHWEMLFNLVDGPVRTGTRAPRKERG